jgi:Fe2+ or Zn2+ uptake regulation protein
LSPTSAKIPDFTPQEHEVVIGLVTQSRNPLSQSILNKVRDQIPRMSIKDIRNYVRLLIQKGQVAAPET